MGYNQCTSYGTKLEYPYGTILKWGQNKFSIDKNTVKRKILKSTALRSEIN